MFLQKFSSAPLIVIIIIIVIITTTIVLDVVYSAKTGCTTLLKKQCRKTQGCMFYPQLKGAKCREICSFKFQRNCLSAGQCIWDEFNSSCNFDPTSPTRSPNTRKPSTAKPSLNPTTNFPTTKTPTVPTVSPTLLVIRPSAKPTTFSPTTRSPTTQAPTKRPITKAPVFTKSPTDSPIVFEPPPIGFSTFVIFFVIPIRLNQPIYSNLWDLISSQIQDTLRLNRNEVPSLESCYEIQQSRPDLPPLEISSHAYCSTTSIIGNSDFYNTKQSRDRIILKVGIPRTKISSSLIHLLIRDINLVLQDKDQNAQILDIKDESIAPQKQSDKPNVILMLADDLGFGDVGYQSCEKFGKKESFGMPCTSSSVTPNIDALSRDQNTAVFSRFYAHIQCSPSRYTILTGKETGRECLFTNALSSNDDQATSLQKRLLSLGKIMKQNGYKTFFSGKWHLGNLTPCGQGCSMSTPGDNGFTRWIATPRSAATVNSNCGCLKSPSSVCNVGIYNTSYFYPQYKDTSRNVDHKYLSSMTTLICDPILEDNGASNPKFYQEPVGETSELLVSRFQQFVNAITDSSPFFATLWFHNPHSPFISTEPYRSRAQEIVRRENPQFCGALFDFEVEGQGGPGPCSKLYNSSECLSQCRDIKTEYYASLMSMDQSIKNTLDFLDAKNLGSNTVVVFSSDNGPARFDRSGYGIRYIGPGSTSGLPGVKLEIREGSLRVPGLIRYPKLISQNTRINSPVAIVDILPTIVELTHTPDQAEQVFLSGAPYDGISIIPFLRGYYRIKRNRPIGYISQNGKRIYMFDTFTLSKNIGKNFISFVNMDGKDLEQTENADFILYETDSKNEMVSSFNSWVSKVGNKCDYSSNILLPGQE